MAELTRATQLLALARGRKIRIAVAESCTGGLLAGAITDVPGASGIFERGFVTYSNAAKIDMLGVSPETIVRFGAVSQQVAREMAHGACSRSNADWAISVTGIAGPGGSEFKPEGRVCFALAKGDELESQTVEFGAIGRVEVRAAAVEHGLDMLIRALGPQP